VLERLLRQAGFDRVAGVDEVGRGCLGGPLVAAAVILQPRPSWRGLRDSKRLSPAARERWYGRLLQGASGWSLALESAAAIDADGIAVCNRRAMARALRHLRPPPDVVIVDGASLPGLEWPQLAMPQADALCASVAAASILAKVARDRLMLAYDRVFPAYGFDRHKGYGSAQHRQALRCHGPCPLHRRSFGA
jgi:ribonuclease HII